MDYSSRGDSNTSAAGTSGKRDSDGCSSVDRVEIGLGFEVELVALDLVSLMERSFVKSPSLWIGLMRTNIMSIAIAKTIPRTNPIAAMNVVPNRPSSQAPNAPGATITSTIASVLANHSAACSQGVLLSGTNPPI